MGLIILSALIPEEKQQSISNFTIHHYSKYYLRCSISHSTYNGKTCTGISYHLLVVAGRQGLLLMNQNLLFVPEIFFVVENYNITLQNIDRSS